MGQGREKGWFHLYTSPYLGAAGFEEMLFGGM